MTKRKDDQCARAMSPDDMPMPFAELSPDGHVIAINGALRKLIGYEGEAPEKIPPLIDLIPPEWRPGNPKTAGEGGTIQFSARLATKDGSRITVLAFARRIDDEKGRLCRILAGVADASMLWPMESSLIRAEQRASLISSLLDSVQSPIFATDKDSCIVYANAYAGRLFGKPAYSVVGTGLWDAYPISHNDLFYRIFQRAIQEHRVLSCDHYAQRLNLWYEVHIYPREGDGMVVVMDNVTARKQYERFMGLAAYAIDRINDYVLWLDSKGLINKANNVAYKNLRFPETPKARVPLSVVAAITPEEWGEIWKEIKKQGSLSFETKLIRSDGGTIPVDATASYVFYVGQEYGCIIARDITSRLMAEEEVTRSMEAAELYLDLMSHDIRNMNQIGIGFLELALNDRSISDGERELLDKALEAFNRSSELISNVKKLQKAKGILSMEEIDLTDMLREVASHYAHIKGRDISIEVRAEEGCHVIANPLLQEVFSNLVGNAVKHSQGRLHVWITLRNDMVADRPCCEVIIEDDGPGIPDEVKKRLFRTKKLQERGGRYRGLGLILVKSLVDDFDGTIRVEDRVPGDYRKGTKFIVTLPAADKDA